MRILNSRDIYEKYPELKNSGVGPYDITALQIVCAITKTGEGEVRNYPLSNADYINTSDNLGRTPLHYASFNGNISIIRLLLENGADVNSNKTITITASQGIDQKWVELKNYIMEVTGMRKSFSMTGTPLHFAISGGFIESAKCLIESGSNIFLVNSEKLNSVELIARHDENSFQGFLNLFLAQLNTYSASFSQTIVKILLKYTIELDRGNYLKYILVQNTGDLAEVQFLAASLGRFECLKLLASDGINLSYSVDDETLLDKIFINIMNPDEFILTLLDDNIAYVHENSTRKVSFDFTILAPNTEPQMEILNNIGNLSDYTDIFAFLNHPLIEVFLKLKWEKVRKFFYLQIVTYSIFVLTLSAYVLQLVNKDAAPGLLSNCIKGMLILSGLTALIHAILQLAFSFRKSYSKYEILMSFLCALLSLVIIFNDHRNSTQDINTPKWILHATSIAILLAWIQLMLLIGRLPTYGYYALMFTAVLQNVIKVLITFVCLLIGFALSFSIQFHSSHQFKNAWLSIVKTTVMMMGEFEYSDLFDDVNEEDPNFRLPATSRVVFLLFIILVSIVLMNLMIGLAVNDIHGLQEEGVTKRCLKQADFLRNFEEVMRLLERINLALGNVFSCVINVLRRSAKLNLKLVLDFNAKASQNYGLPRDFIDQLFLKVLRRKRNLKDIDVDHLESILNAIKSELLK